MRFAIVVAAGLLWAGAAYAQATPEASGPEPSMSQAQTPTTGTGASTDTEIQVTGQATDRNHEIVCHTVMATGSRLAGRGHGRRVCKTREQWEIELDQNRHDMQNSQMVNSSGANWGGQAPPHN